MKLTKNQKRKIKVKSKKKALNRLCENKPKVAHRFIKNGINFKMKKPEKLKDAPVNIVELAKDRIARLKKDRKIELELAKK